MTGSYLCAILLICVSFAFAFALPVTSPPQQLEARQAPNQVAIDYPTDQTAAFNVTTFVLPIPLSEAYSLASPYELILDHGLPTSVIPQGYFPLLLTGGYFHDIRQRYLGVVPLQVEQLSMLLLYLPYVDVLGGGQRPFKRNIKTYMDQLIPTLVSGLTQFVNAEVAIFDPAHAAYKPSGGNTVSLAVSQGIANPIDGPGVVNPLYQAVFSRTSSSPITEAKFRSMLAQPFYTNPGTGCNLVTFYYNYTNANPGFVTGNAQTFTPLLRSSTDHRNAYGYTAATQWVLPSVPVDCKTFA